jgi:hypothetical protein
MTSAIPFGSPRMQVPRRTLRNHTASHDLHKTVDEAFVTALLLTASAERAEAAVLGSNTVTNPDNASAEGLFRGAVNAAIELQSKTSWQSPEELERASSMLPFELRGVLHLPPDLRHCFVLRFLVGLPREVCARWLRLEVRQVDARACTAMLELPTIQSNREALRTN